MARDHDIKAEEARLTSRHPGSVSASLGLVINIGPRTPGPAHWTAPAHCTLCGGEVHRECHSLLTLQPWAQPAFGLFYIFDPIVQWCTRHPPHHQWQRSLPGSVPFYSYSSSIHTVTILHPICIVTNTPPDFCLHSAPVGAMSPLGPSSQLSLIKMFVFGQNIPGRAE